jgi:hypothetical protein
MTMRTPQQPMIEMAGEPDDESHDDEDEGSLDDESEVDESVDLDAEDAEKLEHRRKAQEYATLGTGSKKA